MADGIGDSGTAGRTDVTTWRDTLSAELKDAPGLKDFKDINGLAKSFLDTQALVGSSLRLPGPDASQEAWTEFNKKLSERVPGLVSSKDEEALLKAAGQPTEAAEYKPPENVKLEEGHVEQVRALAKELGLTRKQAEKVFARRAAELDDLSARIAKARVDLKAEWGTAVDERSALAIAAAEKMGAPAELIKNAKAGNLDAPAMKWLYSVAKALGPGEGNVMAREPAASTTPSMTPDEAEAQISELQKNPAWRNENDPRHWTLVQKMVKLVEIANLGKEVGEGSATGHVIGMPGRG